MSLSKNLDLNYVGHIVVRDCTLVMQVLGGIHICTFAFVGGQEIIPVTGSDLAVVKTHRVSG